MQIPLLGGETADSRSDRPYCGRSQLTEQKKKKKMGLPSSSRHHRDHHHQQQQQNKHPRNEQSGPGRSAARRRARLERAAPPLRHSPLLLLLLPLAPASIIFNTDAYVKVYLHFFNLLKVTGYRFSFDLSFLSFFLFLNQRPPPFPFSHSLGFWQGSAVCVSLYSVSSMLLFE